MGELMAWGGVAVAAAGNVATPDNIHSIRPGHSLAPRHYDEILGRVFGTDVTRGTSMQWEWV
jgi:N-acetylneuraminate synthase